MAASPHRPRQAPGPVRLTRRGRVVVVLTLTGGLLGGAVAVAGASFAGAEHAPPAPQLRHVVVRPGDTLWGIAAAAAPSADPRGMVHRITELNDLGGAPLVPGQQLLLPVE